MQPKILSLSTLLVVVLGMTAYGQAATPAEQEPPLRLSEPVEAIIADLERYIPEYMRRENIPGVAIALIHNGETVWTEGFGVKNRITAEPVTADTIFEVASNSKVVTAYVALKLVDQGKLALDEPLNAFLPEPWLPPSEYIDIISLRHVLSHSSGLGHSPLSKDSLFAPGHGYSYSAVGFQYLQAVIEQVTGQPLEAVAQELVFAPLKMSSSSFVNPAHLTSRTASGHLRAIVPALLWAILYLISLLMVGFLGLLTLRIRAGRWRPRRRMVIGTLTVAFGLSLLPPFVLIGPSGAPLEFAWLIALCGFILAIAFALTALAGRVIIVRLAPERARTQLALAVIWGVLSVVSLSLLTGRITNLPVPKWPAVQASAAGSMRATAGDMAAFLIELAEPQHLGVETARQLPGPQVRLSGELSWGLGPGIQHSQHGDALWQWGQHVDFQSVMIIYPEHGFGVVVCTNNDLLNPDVAIEIAHRALAGKIEPIRRASHLEYNYRAEN